MLAVTGITGHTGRFFAREPFAVGMKREVDAYLACK